MIIALQAVNPDTGYMARYQLGARHMSGARESFRHFLRGRGWTEAQIAAAKIEEATPYPDAPAESAAAPITPNHF